MELADRGLELREQPSLKAQHQWKGFSDLFRTYFPPCGFHHGFNVCCSCCHFLAVGMEEKEVQGKFCLWGYDPEILHIIIASNFVYGYACRGCWEIYSPAGKCYVPIRFVKGKKKSTTGRRPLESLLEGLDGRRQICSVLQGFFLMASNVCCVLRCSAGSNSLQLHGL